MNIKSLINQARSVPPKILLKKVADKLKSQSSYKRMKEHDFNNPTYDNYYSGPIQIHSVFKLNDISLNPEQTVELRKAAELIFEHKFDLLGSGPTKVFHGLNAKGYKDTVYPAGEEYNFEKSHTKYNYHYAKEILSAISPDYTPIDWHIDFISGYRWGPLTWYKDIKYGDKFGAEVKTPWEIGRLQHLPVLALASKIFPEMKDKCLTEFQYQVYDFISANPPRFSVQWVTSMDIAFRAANLLISYGLFKSTGLEFEKGFDTAFTNYIYSHGRHIFENLEWASGMRGNHYFANILGLMIIASSLPSDENTDMWLAYSIQEFINETENQFFADGMNFEASLNYHFFMLEMLIYGMVFITNLPKDKSERLKNIKVRAKTSANELLPYEQQAYKTDDSGKIILHDKCIKLITQVIETSCSLMKCNCNIDQIGDNDSGFFISLLPLKSTKINDKTRHLALIKAITDIDIQEDLDVNQFPEYTMIKSVMGDNILQGTGSFKFSDSPVVESKAFNDSGFYIFRNRYFHSSVRCGNIGQYGKGGHAHNDQLSFCFTVGKNEFFVDSGTYRYTSDHEARNRFRSTEMHNTLSIPGMEQNSWEENSTNDLFWLKDNAKAGGKLINDYTFQGKHIGFGKVHSRKIVFSADKISGFDSCEIGNKKYINFHLHPYVEIENEKNIFNKVILKSDSSIIELSSNTGDFFVKKYEYSPAYGELIPSKKIVLNMEGFEANWFIEIQSV